MRAARSYVFLTLCCLSVASTWVWAQEVKKVQVQLQIQKPGLPAVEEKKDEPFDQRKADLETIKTAGYTDDVKSLTDFFRNHTIKENDKARLIGLIKKLGDDSFEVRQATSEEISKCGVWAISILKNATKNEDPEIAYRSELALRILEKVPTRTLALAAARLLAKHKDDSITDALMGYLPLGEDESVAEEISNTFTSLAIRDGKPDSVLNACLESRDVIKRAAAAEAFARVKDKASQARMKEFIKKQDNPDVKLAIAMALLKDAQDKEMVPEIINLMPSVTADKAWKTEEVLWRLAGEDGPQVAVGTDKPSREKARDEWKKWWDANEKKVDLAKLDSDANFGLTIVLETSIRGLGRVLALGGDKKERWSVKGLNWPTDAVPLPGKKVLIAEQNRNRIFEREIDGKELWSEMINQPVNCGRLPNGTTWGVGRNQIIEWERGDKTPRKQIFTFLRNEYDIVAGTRMKNGEYLLLTQSSQILKVDRKGTVTKAIGVGGNGINYYSTIEVLSSGKALITMMNTINEIDLETGKSTWSIPYQFATSAVRLRNGNTLVGNQNTARIQELDKDGKVVKNGEYTGLDPTFRPYRAFKR